MVKKKVASHEGDWLQEVLFFFLEHAYFQSVKTGLKVSTNVHTLQIKCSFKFFIKSVIYVYAILFGFESSGPVVITVYTVCNII